MKPDLRSLALDGLMQVRLVFPATGQILPANEAVRNGSHWFGPAANSSAVAAILTNDALSVQLILGAIAARSRLVSLPLPGRGADPADYAILLNDALAATGTYGVVARDDAARLLEDVGVPAIRHSSLNARSLLAEGDRPDFELIQYTSGTTSNPKPILLSGSNLAANITSILERAEPCAGDVTVSWLPLSHDMGLIGMLLASLGAAQDNWTSGGELVLIEPEGFLRNPGSWLELIDQWRGSFTAAPDFGLRIATRRPPAGKVDLSCLRQVITGGEIIRPATLTAFEEAFAPSGLSQLALAPAYGMAELGLAATLTGPHDRWQQMTVELETLRPAKKRCTEGGEQTVDLAASGMSLHGYKVTASTDDHMIVVETDHAGADGTSGLPLAAYGKIRTKDLGFLGVDGQLYVVGRADDVVVVNGRNLWAPEIESAAGRVPGVRAGRVRTGVRPTGEWFLEVERSKSAQVAGQRDNAGLRSALRQAVVRACGIAPDEIHIRVSGEVQTTSSGKVRRAP